MTKLLPALDWRPLAIILSLATDSRQHSLSGVLLVVRDAESPQPGVTLYDRSMEAAAWEFAKIPSGVARL
jgi:hypothetical protein